MRKAKRVNQKRKQVAREAQGQAKKIGRKYQNAATSGLNAASRSVGEFNNGFREIADEMNEYLSDRWRMHSVHGSSFSTPDRFGRLLSIRRVVLRTHMRPTSRNSPDSETCISV